MPNRYGQPRCTILAVALAATVLGVGGCGASKRPNVLLVVMDTMRADRCSFQGYERPTTPRLDEFAKDAMVFRNAWSPANWTGPAHASLFTGVRPATHGFEGGARPNLADMRPTVAERFAAAGYDTACFTNNEFVSPEFGLTRGFAKYEALFRNERRPYPTATDTHTVAGEWAEAVHAKGRPFFLFVNDTEPHQPYTPPETDAARFLRGSPSISDLSEARAFSKKQSLAYNLGLADVGAPRLELLSDLYDAEILALDRAIGDLLDRLRAKGLLDSTLVVIVGDHGEYLGEHRLLDHGIGLYRQVLQVPMLLRYPGTFDRGRVVPSLVRLEDLAPTMLEVCGLDPLPGDDSASLTRNLAGRVARARQSPHDLVSLFAAREFPETDTSQFALGIQSVFDGELHLIVWSDGRTALYDTARDPAENADVSAERPGEVARLKELLPPTR